MVIFVFSTEKAMGIAGYMKKKLENVDLVGELLVMTLCFESQFGFQFHSRRPAQPANQPKIQKWANLANFHPIELNLGTEVLYNLPDGN